MTKDRTDYIAGLRAIADLLEDTPDLPLPVTNSLHWYLFGSELDLDGQKAEAARIVRLIGGHHDKQDTTELFRFIRHFGAIKTEVIVDRPAVCERIVVGTETVTKQVPDPTAPQITVTETVEQVEWRCHPLLADAEAVSA